MSKFISIIIKYFSRYKKKKTKKDKNKLKNFIQIKPAEKKEKKKLKMNCDREDSSVTTTRSSSSSGFEQPVAEGLEDTKPISFYRLFQFSTNGELCLLFIGLLMSAVKALTLPAIVIIYSEFTAMLVDRTLRIGTSSETYALPLFGGGRQL